MNLRILKKLSKRAAPYLPLLGDRREQFAAEPHDNYHGLIIRARKHWERSHCHPTFDGFGDDIVFTTRAGRRVVMRQPYHPWPGTIMVGSMTGYYQPEWEEESAWGALNSHIRNHFCDWDEEGPTLTRRFRNPGDVFRAADELVDASTQVGIWRS